MLCCGYWIGSNFFTCIIHNISVSHTIEITLSICPKQLIQTPELIDRIVFGDGQDFFLYEGLLFQAEHPTRYEYLATKTQAEHPTRYEYLATKTSMYYRDTPIQADQIYIYMETLATEFIFKGITLL